jgi:hypothetical protein
MMIEHLVDRVPGMGVGGMPVDRGGAAFVEVALNGL